MDRIMEVFVELEKLAQQKEMEADEIWRKTEDDETYYNFEHAQELLSEAIGIRIAMQKILDIKINTKTYGRGSAFS